MKKASIFILPLISIACASYQENRLVKIELREAHKSVESYFHKEEPLELPKGAKTDHVVKLIFLGVRSKSPNCLTLNSISKDRVEIVDMENISNLGLLSDDFAWENKGDDLVEEIISAQPRITYLKNQEFSIGVCSGQRFEIDLHDIKTGEQKRSTYSIDDGFNISVKPTELGGERVELAIEIRCLFDDDSLPPYLAKAKVIIPIKSTLVIESRMYSMKCNEQNRVGSDYYSFLFIWKPEKLKIVEANRKYIK